MALQGLPRREEGPPEEVQRLRVARALREDLEARLRHHTKARCRPWQLSFRCEARELELWEEVGSQMWCFSVFFWRFR